MFVYFLFKNIYCFCIVLNRINITGLLLVFTAFVVSVYVESVASGKLLFLEGFLTKEVCDNLMFNPRSVIVSLGVINLILFAFSHSKKESKEKRKVYDNICQLIFDNFIKSNGGYENSTFRVSLFLAKKGIILRRYIKVGRIKLYFVPQYRTFLKNVGRYQTRQEKRHSRIKFLPQEGAVGNCYETGEIVFMETISYSQKNEAEYFKEQIEKSYLPLFKAKKLNTKSCAFLCCPVKFFKQDDIFGVIVVDCTHPNKMKKDHFRAIEETISNYTVFFTKES